MSARNASAKASISAPGESTRARSSALTIRTLASRSLALIRAPPAACSSGHDQVGTPVSAVSDHALGGGRDDKRRLRVARRRRGGKRALGTEFGAQPTHICLGAPGADAPLMLLEPRGNTADQNAESHQ